MGLIFGFGFIYKQYCNKYLYNCIGFVSRVEKVGGQRTSSAENAYGLEIACKDIRSLRFSLSKTDSAHPRKEICETLRLFSFPISHNSRHFAFDFNEKYPVDGWAVYDPVSELKRLGVNGHCWRISRINEQYELWK